MSRIARAERLRAYDGCRREFIAECAERFEAGERLAGEDARALDELAMEIAGAAMAWRALFQRLDVARRDRRTSFDASGAAMLAAETVFDEWLLPSATRLLFAALALHEIDA